MSIFFSDTCITVSAKLTAIAKRKKASLRDVQSLVGTLNFACRVIAPGRRFLRRLIDLIISKSNPNHWIRLNREARKYINVIPDCNGTISFLPVDLGVIRRPSPHNGCEWLCCWGSFRQSVVTRSFPERLVDIPYISERTARLSRALLGVLAC